MARILSWFVRHGFRQSRLLVGRAGRFYIFDEMLKHLDKFRTGGLPFLQMVKGKLLQKLFAIAGELDQNAAAIIIRAQTEDKTSLHEPVDQFDGAVVL